jgi:hypothetical protein
MKEQSGKGTQQLPPLKFPEHAPATQDEYLKTWHEKGFHSAYRSTYDSAARSSKRAEISYRYASPDEPSYICNEMNKWQKSVRASVATKMQNYIIEHNGVIDSWGNDDAGISIRFESPGSGRIYDFPLDFFGSDFTFNGRRKIARSKKHRKFNFYYNYVPSEEYTAAQKKESALAEEMNDAYKKICNGKKNGLSGLLIGILATLYIIYSLLVLLVLHIGHGQCDWLYHLVINEDAPGIWWIWETIKEIPWAAYELLILISDHGMVYYVIGIILLAAGIFGAYFFYFLAQDSFNELVEFNKKKSIYRQKKRAWKKFVRSNEYKQLLKQYDIEKKLNEAYAKKWQRAWFDWLNSADYISDPRLI